MRKRLFCIAAFFLLMLAGCSRNDAPAQHSETNWESSYSIPEDIPKPYSIYWISHDGLDPENGQDIWDAEFTRLTGIILNHVYIPGSEYNQRIDQQAATGTLPDLFDLGYTYYPEYAAKGLLADLTDVVHESGLYDAVAPALWDQVTIDGRIYGIPKEYPRGRATYVRKDWLDRLGMDVPETYEEFITMLERFRQEIPECSIPYVAPDVVSSAYLPEFYQGAQTEIIPVNGTWVDGMMQPNMVTALENLRQAYQSGLLDQDVITASTTAARDAWNTGIVGCFCYWGGDWGQKLTENLQANVPEAEVLCIPPIEGAAYLYSRPTSHVINGKLSEEQIEQIFWYFLCYIHDGGQGQTLFELGVEGVHWEQIGDHVEMLPSLSNPAITLPKAHVLPTCRITPMKDESKTPEYSPSYLMSLKIVEDYALPQYFQPASATYSRIAGPLTEMRNDIIARIITGDLGTAEGLELYKQYAKDLGLYQALAEMNN